MDYDQARIDDVVLALLAAFSFEGGRSWKGFNFDVMDRLHAQGLISEPKGKAKSVCLTQEGLDRGYKCARSLFCAPSPDVGQALIGPADEASV
jgi:hypothetical protein